MNEEFNGLGKEISEALELIKNKEEEVANKRKRMEEVFVANLFSSSSGHFEIRHTVGMGRGLFACRDYAEGEVITVEEPLVSVKKFKGAWLFCVRGPSRDPGASGMVVVSE